MPPESVTVALSPEEHRSLQEAAEALSVPLPKLLSAGAVAFARLCGFRKHAAGSVARSPDWGTSPEPTLPEAILEVPLDPETADQVEAAAAYVRWEGPDGSLSVTLPEYVVGSTIRLIRETRLEGSPPRFRGLAEQLFGSPPAQREPSPQRASLEDDELATSPTVVKPLANAPATPRGGVEQPVVGNAVSPSFAAPPAPTPARAPMRPSYTLPRPARSSNGPTQPGREPEERARRSEARERPLRKSPLAEPSPKAAKGPPRQPLRHSDRAEAPPASSGGFPALVQRLKERPLYLAGGAAAFILLLVLVAAYSAAVAPPERKRLVAPSDTPLSERTELPPSRVDSLQLDAVPPDRDGAALELKRWEGAVPAGEGDAPPPLKGSRNHGKNIDQILVQRYGRPNVPADASLKPEAYDADIAAAVADVARIYAVPPALVKAVIRRESNYNPNALSQAGAIGMMQLMPYTAKKVGLRVTDLWVPRKNILGGTRLLSVLLQYYNGDVMSALTAYNARPRDPLAPLPKNGETPEYVAAVLRYYEEYNGGPLPRTRPKGNLDAPLSP